MAALQRSQLHRLCSNPETFEKAQSIMRLVNARTRPGSGFVIKSPVAIPAVCAYLASQQLNTGEVSLQSALSAACVTQAEFTDILRKVEAALRTEEGNTPTNVTYETLVDAHRVHPREEVIACMEDAEAALPRVDILKERYGANVVSCVVFYWVCQLLEETTVQERSLRQAYSILPKTFKAILTTLDKQCDAIAEQIKTYLLQKRDSAQGSIPSSQPDRVSKPAPASPQKSPTKSAMRPKTTRQISTPAVTPSRKRTVAFSRLSSDGDGGYDGHTSYPETPTKKRRIDRTTSPIKPSASNSPTKRSSAAATAAFHAAIKGSPAGQESESPVAGPSTPRRPRHAKAAGLAVTPVQTDAQPSPSRSQGQASPSRPTVRRRFRPVFLEQEQWYARDPKVERMWAAAGALRDELVRLHGHPFQGVGQCGGTVVGAA